MIPQNLFQLSQKERILEFLKLRGREGVMVYEIIAPRPEGLGVAQYNARILELRELGHNIVNLQPGHFILRGYDSQPDKTYKPIELQGEAKKSWEQMGKYLRGEAPKPESTQLETKIQEALY